MFYEETKLNEELTCNKCRERLDDPRILPCGDTICSDCVLSIRVADNNKFDCLICEKKHTMPDDGLPVNKKLLAILSLKPSEVYRGQIVQKLKEALNEIHKKSTQLTFGSNNGIYQIKEHCINLKNELQLSTEEAIKQINEYNLELIKEIEQYEKECVKSYDQNYNLTENFSKIIKKLDSFHAEWTHYLKQTTISDESILKANNQADYLSK